MICRNCGQQTGPRFCGHCGQEVDDHRRPIVQLIAEASSELIGTGSAWVLLNL